MGLARQFFDGEDLRVRGRSSTEGAAVNEITLVGVDLGKHVFHLCCQDCNGYAVMRKKVARSQIFEFFGNLPPCTVAMEACPGSHFLSRQVARMGHAPRLISPRFVRAFVKNNKNDFIDAEAICEAASRPTMRFVSPKTEEQQTISALHRVRQSLVRERVVLNNQIQAFLLEFGIAASRGMFTAQRLAVVTGEGQLPLGIASLLSQLEQRSAQASAAIRDLEKQMTRLLNGDPAGQRLLSIPGIGPITASALIGELGNGSQFSCGRDFAASLGLTPRQRSTGGIVTLIGISKRGDKDLRTLLVLCARLYMFRLPKESGPLADWVRALSARRPSSVVACALANKFARIAWAIVARNSQFEAHHLQRNKLAKGLSTAQD